MKARDILDLAKEIAQMQPKKEEKQMPRRRAPRHMKHFKEEDFVQKLHYHLDQADLLKQVLEDRQKTHKKEDKKDDKKGLSLEQTMIMLVGSYPIIGLLVWYYAR